MTTALRAGAASTIITPAPGLEMGGYIARTQPSAGSLDDLRCQAVVFEDSSARLALAVCDLLYMTEPIRARVCAQLRQRLGMADHQIMLAATHTHCGPAHLASANHEGLLSHLADGIADAVCRAAQAARPARLLAASTEVAGISACRRDPATPVDRIAQLIIVVPEDGTGQQAPAGREAIAVLASFPCHATVLEHDTCYYSADFPGAMRQALEALCGGTAVFVQGCAADINPIFTEHTVAECARTGSILAAACAARVMATARLGRNARVINLSLGTELPVPDDGTWLVGPAPLRARLARVPVTTRPRPAPDDVRHELAGLHAELDSLADPLARPKRRARQAELWIEDLLLSHPQRFDCTDPPADPPALPVQVFGLGQNLAIVALPGEPFTATGLAIRAVFPGTVLVAGYANNAAGYLPTSEEFRHSGYEIGSSQYAPGTAEQLANTASALLGDL